MIEHSPATPSPDTRRKAILESLEANGAQSVEQLAERFGVSGMTVRRDLQELANTGHVIRTHGGAAPAGRVSFEFRFLERSEQHADEKEQIADVAASLVCPGQAVLLDSSTTTLAIARKLKAISPLKVITTSLPIASELFGLDHIDVILLGGQLRKDSPDLAGPITDHSLDILRADIAFLGADAIDAEGNAYNQSPEVARLITRMAACAQSAFAVADHSKIGGRELMRISHLSEWDGLITDNGVTPALRKTLTKTGVHLLQPNKKTTNRRPRHNGKRNGS